MSPRVIKEFEPGASGCRLFLTVAASAERSSSASNRRHLEPLEGVEFNDGEIRKYEHTSDVSGKKVYVEFCPTCGTTVGLTFERWPNLRALSRGCYDDPNAVEVAANIWTRSAQSGVALPAGIDCFAKARLTPEGQPEHPAKYPVPVMAR
jgi:hypothetical protein